MPFVYDHERPDRLDDDSPPKLRDFEYLPPPEFGGAGDPVRFSLQETLHFPRAEKPAHKPDLIGFLRGLLRRPARQVVARPTPADDMRVVLPKLRALGATKAYCRYDGGNDESFAWLDHVVLRDGSRLGVDEILRRMDVVELEPALRSLFKRRRPPGSDYWSAPAERLLRNAVRNGLAEFGAELMLGGGNFGNGPMSLFGAFTIDFEAGLVVDDPNAEPVVENIQIDREKS